jgi:hypothetical protein
MMLKRLKKVILLLIIIKLIFFVFFIFQTDLVNISREINTSGNYLEGFENDSTGFIRQKAIRIVRNADERGISIILREKKNTKHLREKKEEISLPVVD